MQLRLVHRCEGHTRPDQLSPSELRVLGQRGAPESLFLYHHWVLFTALPPPCGAEKGFDDVRCVQSSVNGTGIPVGFGGHSPFPGVWEPALTQVAFPVKCSNPDGKVLAAPPVPTTCLPSSPPLHLPFLGGLSAVTNSAQPSSRVRPSQAEFVLLALRPPRAWLSENWLVLLAEPFKNLSPGGQRLCVAPDPSTWPRLSRRGGGGCHDQCSAVSPLNAPEPTKCSHGDLRAVPLTLHQLRHGRISELKADGARAPDPITDKEIEAIQGQEAGPRSLQ